MSPLAHTDVDIDGRRYRVILRDGEPVGVAAWVVEEFGPRVPHGYWRRLWSQGRRAHGRVARMVIAKAMGVAPEALAVA